VKAAHLACGSTGAADVDLIRALDVLGKRWSGALIEVIARGPIGFAGLRRAVDGITDSILAARLAEFQQAGLVERSVSEAAPVRVTYRATEPAEAAAPILAQLAEWARNHLEATAAVGLPAGHGPSR
jgi:DNA-binding HxlR family transcriptional regulator